MSLVLQSGMSEAITNKMIINDISDKVVMAVLEYIYSDKFTVEADDATSLLMAASR